MSKAEIRVALLVCDRPADSIVAVSGDYSQMFGRLLRDAGTRHAPPVDFHITAFDVVNNPSATDNAIKAITDTDAVVITGSKYGVGDGLEWTQRLINYVQLAEATKRIKIIGVCFGHQVVAAAFGGKVERNTNPIGYKEVKNPQGWEAGWTKMIPTDAGKTFFGDIKDSVAFYSMHKDIVTVCPPGFSNLLTTDLCPFQSLLKDDSILTIQAHPEFSAEVVREIIQLRKEIKVFNEDYADDLLAILANNPQVESSWFSDKVVSFLLKASP
ncbi:hypothetical protein HK100_001776 [Physocladia obscura]|uniref:Glutamine amidotransferase domain-containing protein n=1 Tax=Physocladia obscura TaxID=109957 RepID=A0AAD5XAS8_9FUNG|nr:hypothetical protein HK100_001776 [Physocladia obscura]